VLVFPDQGGPSSRKGTLAGALASGAPLVALEGPRMWPELRAAGALETVPPDSDSLAEALRELLADEPRRRALGARGRAFAETRMGLARTAREVLALLAEMPRERQVRAARA
jgi:glycosyltransferase involved in cell wall biosynthesis